jgi:hypothetical protein
VEIAINWLDEIEVEELTPIFRTEENEEQLKERFKITDLSTLNWALRKLLTLDKKRAEEVELADAEIERIRTWSNKQGEAYEYSKQFLEGLVEEYAREQRANDPKWKGNKTPYGKVGFRKQTKWDYGDEKLLVDYLEKNFNFLVKVEKTPMKAEIKKDFTNVNGQAVNKLTGEILPGIIISEIDSIVTIKLED